VFTRNTYTDLSTEAWMLRDRHPIHNGILIRLIGYTIPPSPLSVSIGENLRMYSILDVALMLYPTEYIIIIIRYLVPWVYPFHV
jgi:hypothetical protein